MRILVSDETNLTPTENIKFFLYGGVIFDSSSVMAIGDAVQEIRSFYSIESHERIKFNIKSCPASVTREQHKAIKNRLIDLATEHNAQVIINCVLHDIARNKTINQLVEMTSKIVFRRFNQYCHENNVPGIVLAHRWPYENGFNFLESCQFGEIRFMSGFTISLPNIHGYAQVSDNSTTLMSVADVVLGAFRYCINNRDKTDVNTELMPRIARLMWYREENGVRKLRDRGLNISPRDVVVDSYRREYESLISHVLDYANSRVTGRR